MRKIKTQLPFVAALFAVLTAYLAAPCFASGEPAPAENNIKENYVMLYYRDLVSPRHFYGDLLGLKATFEDEWVTLYQLTPASYVGVVKEGPGAYHQVQKKNAVMLSLVTDDVDAWYLKFTKVNNITILKEIYNNENVPIRAFLVQDPGGYTVEFFQWLNQSGQ